MLYHVIRWNVRLPASGDHASLEGWHLLATPLIHRAHCHVNSLATAWRTSSGESPAGLPSKAREAEVRGSTAGAERRALLAKGSPLFPFAQGGEPGRHWMPKEVS
jgi:hypothetical protein